MISRSSLRLRQMSPVYFASSSAKREMAQNVVSMDCVEHWHLAFLIGTTTPREISCEIFNSKMAAARILTKTLLDFWIFHLKHWPKFAGRVIREKCI